VLAFLQGYCAESRRFGVTGVDEVAGILNREDRLVRLGALGCLASVGCQDLADLNVLVLEKAVCGFGFCPICAGLVDGAFWRVREPVAQRDQPCIEPLLAESDIRKFLSSPMRLVFAVHCAPPHVSWTLHEEDV